MTTELAKKSSAKPTAYIFGAGTAGKQAYRNLRDNYEVLGFCDNDESKHHSVIDGVPVYSPTQLSTSPAEYVFIASEFFEQIRSQLIEQYGIPADSLSHLPARLLASKRFERDIESIGLSLSMLNACCQILKEFNLFHHIDAGTLLGLYRDQSLIPWDDDMDIAVDSEGVNKINDNLERFTQCLESLTSERWRADVCYADKSFGNVPLRAIRSFKFVCTVADRFPSIDFFVKYRSEEFSDYCLASRAIRMPAEYTKSTSTFHCAGFHWPIPQNTHAYLTYHYGNWETPDPNWSLQDLNNTVTF
ncbi:LicD family protein [Alteromonas facilis]|uniref:LicD family protein n=1 Tax=Alteromonas facilis TaxID=2048004 RepID=UPI000C290360|nr:LicD family protein [Alteromonas facilis]